MKRLSLIAVLLLTGCPYISKNQTANNSNPAYSQISRKAYYQNHKLHYIDEYNDIALSGVTEYLVQIPMTPSNPLQADQTVFSNVVNRLTALGYPHKVAMMLPFIIVPVPEVNPEAIRKHFYTIDGIENVTGVYLHGEGDLGQIPFLPPANKIEGNWFFAAQTTKPLLSIDINRNSDGWAVLCGTNATGSFDGSTLRVTQRWDPSSAYDDRFDSIEYEGQYKSKNSYVLGQYRKLIGGSEISTGSFLACWMWGNPSPPSSSL